MGQADISTVLQQQLPTLAVQVADTLRAAGIESYLVFSEEGLVSIAHAALAAFVHDITDDSTHWFSHYWEQVAEQRAQQGVKVEDLLQGVFASEAVLNALVVDQLVGDIETQLWWANRLHAIIYTGIITLSRVFTAVREQIIRFQQAQIRELSTPIIPLHTGVLALPLVGTIDSRRAGQVMETLLEGISEHQADVVIMDITGVPVVDTSVANYLLQASRAARLLGAQVVLVGISAEVAQTITQLGADLSDIMTRANMQEGIAYALGLQGLAIGGQR
jgi:rsbT co-antagonist protein RsbR